MPWHDWGSEFDFDGLSKAEQWLKKVYRRATRNQMITKEKYGTIRYEFTYLWMTKKKDRAIFLELLKRTTIKFPEFAGEIVSDMIPDIDVKDKVSAYYKGYFDAILMVKHKSKWETYK